METNVHELNVFQKLIKVKETADGFFRDASSPGIRYKYVSGSQILDKITDCMNTIGLVLVPKSAIHREWKQYDYKNAKGEPKTDFIVMGDLTYCLVNSDKPTDIWEIPWQYYGQQDEISKAFGSGLTYSERYILLKVLGLPTDEDDPDGKPAEPPSGKDADSKFKKNTPSNTFTPKPSPEPQNPPTTPVSVPTQATTPPTVVKPVDPEKEYDSNQSKIKNDMWARLWEFAVGRGITDDFVKNNSYCQGYNIPNSKKFAQRFMQDYLDEQKLTSKMVEFTADKKQLVPVKKGQILIHDTDFVSTVMANIDEWNDKIGSISESGKTNEEKVFER